MFTTDITHFLQQLDNNIFYAFMVFISSLGSLPFIMTVILGITFGIDFKKGLVLINIIAWTALLTVVAKQQIDFPRPIDVDPSVTANYQATDVDLRDQQPSSFWQVFSDEVLSHTRTDQFKRYGFPSGHTSIQVALWASLFFLFRKKWIAMLGISIVLLTMLSRLYLGHHFLADVFGGLFIGMIVSSLLIYLIVRSRYLEVLSHQFYSLSILWLPAILIPFANFIPIWIVGTVIGINIAAALIILIKNFPVFHVIIWKRILAALISLIVIFAGVYINKSTTYTNNNFLDLLIVSAISFLLIIGSITLSNRIHLIRFRF